MEKRSLRKGFNTYLALGLSVMLFAVPAWSQDEEEEAAELGKIEITGSRLSQTDIETARPVTVITREQIELSGFETVAQVLQSTPYNSFGSFRETSGYANGQAVVNNISLRGLGSQRTLLLLDGRRVSGTGGSGGAAANLNQIPLALVERIDILRDGASAIYGSDAIGGVVNIITRKDFDGVNLSFTSGKPDTKGGEYIAATITGGTSNSKGNTFFTVQHYGQHPSYWRDTEWSHAYNYESYSSFGFPGTFYSPYFGYMADSRCPEVPVGGVGLYGNNGSYQDQLSDDGTNSNPDYPNSYTWYPYSKSYAGTAYADWSFCGYDYAQDIIMLPRAKRNGVLLKSTYDISPDVTMNAVLMISQNDADSRYAGTPVTGPYPTMSADNPNHPLIGMGYDCSVMDCLGATVFIRTVPNGTRDNTVVSNIQDLRVGFEGVLDVLGGATWEFNLQVMNNDIDNQTINLVNKPLLQKAIDDGLLDIFGVHGTPLSALASTMQQFNHTKLYQADLKSTQGDFITKFDIGELRGGPIGMVLGAEYNHLAFDQINDPASKAQLIAGTAGGDNVQSDRSRKSVFFELGLPFTEKIEMSLAGRHDTYSSAGIGGNFSPQITFAYRPVDWILLRGTYGEGFRVAAMTQLYGERSESYPSGIDVVGCANGKGFCASTQYRTLYGGNPDLKPELSDHWTMGIVLSPLPELTMQVGFWHTDFTDLISTSSIQREFNAEAAGDVNYVTRCPAGGIPGCPDGAVDYISLQVNNFAGVEAEGLDFDLTYIIDTENAGRFDIGISGAKYTKYIVQSYPESPRIEYQGEMGLPDLRMNPHVYWGKGDWNVALTGYYIAGQSEVIGGTTYDVGGHYEVNMQVEYQLPWDASVAFGATNLMNTGPETNGDYYGWYPLDWSLYDTRGRTAYIRYEQSL
ncbi:uncharacterized protein METZ01_LOCUS126385 [marine metagenome]|uniref:TonB-dependent receptor plug domain-containing protein n=1 Tax=marine metagenome TaxID=408172 RepID=A0A381YAA1_9ZZZZ